MTFYVENEVEKEFPFDIEKQVELVATKALEMEHCPFSVLVNVLITDNEGIRSFNKEYRNIDRETDVLSFPNLDFEEAAVFDIPEQKRADYTDPESGEVILGDIILSYDRIYEQAESYGHSVLREFSFLVVHSILHLCGYDHMTEEEAKVMEEKQEKVLIELGITRD